MIQRSRRSPRGDLLILDVQAVTEMQKSSQTDAMDFELPSNLEPIRLLGQGSMASVILARDSILKRLVAVKFLRQELAADAVCQRRFEREAQAAAKLSHDCVTTVYSVGRIETGEPYIVMEYVDGNNLADVLSARGPFEIDESIALLVQISSALAAAHEKDIVHRDVKPANILIDGKSGRATLTDFGVAAILESGTETMTRLTRADERLGDPRYMSPEQLRGESLTGQTDIYSLGIIGYELLTGNGPFDDAEIRDMASAHLRRPPPDLSQLRADVPRPLANVLSHCLAKSPVHRPGAKELPKLLQDPVDLSTGDSAAGPVSEFLHELQQRKVYRTAVAYAAVSFVILQVADLVLPALIKSDLFYQIIVIACLAGFPLAIILAWFYELRNGRVVRTDENESAHSRTATPSQRLLLKLVGLGLSIALVYVIARWILLP